jgi:hypothetical protein
LSRRCVSANIDFPVEGSMTSNRFALLLLAVLSVQGCTYPQAFQKATVAFATATSTGTERFVPAFDTASTICHTRERLDFLQRRLQPGAPWGQAPYYTDWYEGARINPSNPSGETWKQHCDRIADVEEVYRHALGLLDAYARGLADLATSGTYDGCDLRDMAKYASDLGQKVSSAPIVGKTISGLGEPMARLTEILLARRTLRQMRESVAAANPVIQQILSALADYTKSTDAELRDADARLKDLLVTMEIRVGARGRGADPADVMSFYRFASEKQDELEALRKSQARYASVVADLAHAHDMLAQAAVDKGPKGIALLKKVLADATGVLRAASHNPEPKTDPKPDAAAAPSGGE